MKIRKSVFETNSSSSHTVIIDGRGDFEPVHIRGDEVTIDPGEFGWGPDTLLSWYDKASYAYVHAVNYGTPEDMELLEAVIANYTKKRVVFARNDDDKWNPTGYIDHQSVGEAAQMFVDTETLKQAIFGVGSYVIIDNDNN